MTDSLHWVWISAGRAWSSPARRVAAAMVVLDEPQLYVLLGGLPRAGHVSVRRDA
ncbi:hypothetical protein ACIBI3_21615 [Actinomadura luteofluorescens]|uniref:hypothetical protein n=1 Tax=Actinomadura luteofluorescens TaxID=46163 RepID=UPI00348AE4B0